MTFSTTRSSVAERRLAIARRIFQALAAQDPHRALTLCDGGGGVMARHDPLPTDEADYAMLRRLVRNKGV
jgi:hypothetical protein